jgi:hypothetical protein
MVSRQARGSEPRPMAGSVAAVVWGSGGWLEADPVAEGFEFCDEGAGFPAGVQRRAKKSAASSSQGLPVARRAR